MDDLETLQTAIGGFGIAALAAFVEAGDSLQSYGLQVQRVAFITNTSTQETSRLIAGFEGVGISSEQAGSLLQRLEMRLGTMIQAHEKAAAAGKTSSTALDQLGISATDAHGKALPLTQLIPQIVDKLRGMDDATQRAVIGQQLFGRNWSSLAPLIEAGGQAFLKAMEDADKFGIVLSPGVVDQAHQAEIANVHLQEALQGVTVAMGERSMPVITAWKEGIANAVAGVMNFSPALTNAALTIAGTTAVMGPLVGGASAMTSVLSNVSQILPGFGSEIEKVGRAFFGFLGPIGLVIAALLILHEAYDHIAVVHQLLAPIVDRLTDAFNHLAQVFSAVTGAIHAGESPAQVLTVLLGSVSVQLGDLARHFQGSPLGSFLQVMSDLITIFNRTRDATLTFNVALIDFGMSGQQAVNTSETLGRFFSTLGSILHTLIEGGLQFTTTFRQTHDVLASLAAAFTSLGAPANLVGAIFGTLRQIGQQLQAAWNQIAVATMPALNQAAAQLGPTFVRMAPTLELIGHLLQIFASDLLLVGGVLAGVAAAILVILLSGAFHAFVEFLTVAIPAAILVATGVIQVLAGVFQVLASIVIGVVSIIADLFQGKWAQAWTDAQLMVQGVANGVISILEGLVTVATGLIYGLVGGLIAILHGFVTGVVDGFMWLYHMLVGGSIIPDMVNGILNWFLSLNQRALALLWSLVGGAVSAAVSLGWGVLNAIVGTLGGLGGALWGVVGGAFGSLLGMIGGLAGIGAAMGHAIVSGVLGALGGLGWALRNAISSAISWLPGPAQDALHAIGLQEGAIVGPGFGGPRFAMVGEGSSAEAITPIDRLPGLISQALAQAGIGGGGPQTIVLQVDGREMARVVLNHAADRWKAYGGTVGSGA